jgi:hypothetical protein
VGRGLATGDVDDDGDVDLVVTENGGPARLLLNEAGNRRPWLGLRLVGESGADALGALVEVLRAGGPRLVRRVRTDGSYLSASDPRLLFGLGDRPAVDHVEVRWPGGRVERFAAVPGKWQALREGTGTGGGS